MSTRADLIAAVRRDAEGTPYQVVEQPYGFDLTINIVDAQWYTLMRKNGISKVFTFEVRLDEAQQKLAITDVANEVRWDAGASLTSPPSLHAQASTQKGRVYEFSSEKQWGVDAKTKQVGKVVDYTFSSGEGRAIIRDAAQACGWSEAMGAEAKVGLYAAIFGVGIVLVIGIIALVIALTR